MTISSCSICIFSKVFHSVNVAKNADIVKFISCISELTCSWSSLTIASSYIFICFVSITSLIARIVHVSCRVSVCQEDYEHLLIRLCAMLRIGKSLSIDESVFPVSTGIILIGISSDYGLSG